MRAPEKLHEQQQQQRRESESASDSIAAPLAAQSASQQPQSDTRCVSLWRRRTMAKLLAPLGCVRASGAPTAVSLAPRRAIRRRFGSPFVCVRVRSAGQFIGNRAVRFAVAFAVFRFQFLFDVRVKRPQNAKRKTHEETLAREARSRLPFTVSQLFPFRREIENLENFCVVQIFLQVRILNNKRKHINI